MNATSPDLHDQTYISSIQRQLAMSTLRRAYNEQPQHTDIMPTLQSPFTDMSRMEEYKDYQPHLRYLNAWQRTLKRAEADWHEQQRFWPVLRSRLGHLDLDMSPLPLAKKSIEWIDLEQPGYHDM